MSRSLLSAPVLLAQDGTDAEPRPDVRGNGRAREVCLVPLSSLKPGPALRTDGEDEAHARLLAQATAPLPPILVHRSSMEVLDGMHRLLAAAMCGETHVAVEFFEGSEAEAFVEAVRHNTKHGKPLTLSERELAAERLATLHPEWSNRGIAEVCGLSPKTVAGIRRRASGDIPQLSVRLGRDGRARPIDPGEGRKRVVDALSREPQASSRSVARTARSSVATVRDVRQRLAAGIDPLPPRLRNVQDDARPDEDERRAGYELADDRAFTATPTGARFAEWFDAHRIEECDWADLLEGVPISRIYLVGDEARRRAERWVTLSTQLQQRLRQKCSDTRV